MASTISLELERFGQDCSPESREALRKASFWLEKMRDLCAREFTVTGVRKSGSTRRAWLKAAGIYVVRPPLFLFLLLRSCTQTKKKPLALSRRTSKKSSACSASSRTSSTFPALQTRSRRSRI